MATSLAPHARRARHVRQRRESRANYPRAPGKPLMVARVRVGRPQEVIRHGQHQSWSMRTLRPLLTLATVEPTGRIDS